MKITLFAVAICVLAGLSSQAQTRSNEIGFQSDNDSFLAQGSDRYYTNGFFINYRHGIAPKKFGGKLANAEFGLTLGQKIFNAQSGSLPSVEFLDRPIAGYLFLNGSANLLYKDETTVKLGATLGIVGPAAGGYPIQKFIHNTFGFYELNSWEHQIRNAAIINFNVEVNKLLARGSWIDLTANFDINFGTGFNNAAFGPLVRLGNFNQLFQSVSTQSTATQNTSNKLLHDNEFFFYYKPQVHGILYDATVQGNIFQDHPVAGTEEVTADIKRLVVTNQVGVAYAGSRFIFDAAAIFSTKDVKGMAHAHQWGSLTVMYRFN